MTTKPDYLDRLLDAASETAGSDYQLAKLLNTQRSAISMWRAGTRPCPVEDQALMASIAGLKADEWLTRAVIAKHEGTAKGDALFKALGKALVATGAVIGSVGANAQAIFSLTPIADAVTQFIRCILC